MKASELILNPRLGLHSDYELSCTVVPSPKESDTESDEVVEDPDGIATLKITKEGQPLFLLKTDKANVANSMLSAFVQNYN